MVEQVSSSKGTTIADHNYHQDGVNSAENHKSSSLQSSGTTADQLSAQQTTQERLLNSPSDLEKLLASDSSNNLRDPESVGDPVQLPPVNQRHPLAVAVAFLSGETQGQHIDFPPGSSMSESFKNGDGAKFFEAYVLKKCGGRVPGGTVTDFAYTFTWPRATQTANSAEQVVGSWSNGSAYIDNNGTIHFSVENTMSLNSLFFGRQLSEYGLPSIGSSKSDTTMTIRWSSP